MVTINELIAAKMPDEAEIFSSSLEIFISEAMALAGFDGKVEGDLSDIEKSLIADMAAESLVMPSLSHYKKSIKKAEGEDAGSVEYFDDKLEWLKEIKEILKESIRVKWDKISWFGSIGVPMLLV